jgi:ribonuclease HII
VKLQADWQREKFYTSRGRQAIVGLDEVGRGCLAGPLVAAAFSFARPWPEFLLLFDSKQLSPEKRNDLAQKLVQYGSVGIGVAEATEIDTYGLQLAQYKAYIRALDNLVTPIEIVLLDGRPWRDCPYPHEAIVKGDCKVASIAAASILAKVYRDTYMQTVVHERFPDYGFNLHVGYGTKKHLTNLTRFGPCREHRQTFKPVADRGCYNQ